MAFFKCKGKNIQRIRVLAWKDAKEEGEKEMKCNLVSVVWVCRVKTYSHKKEERVWELVGECVVVCLDGDKSWLQVLHNCIDLQECPNISVFITWKLLKLVLNFDNSKSIFWVLSYVNWKKKKNNNKFSWGRAYRFWELGDEDRVLAKPNTQIEEKTNFITFHLLSTFTTARASLNFFN